MERIGHEVTAGLERLNALLAWWGLHEDSGNPETDEEVRKLHAFTSTVATTYEQACGDRTALLTTANAQLVQSLQDFLQHRHPNELPRQLVMTELAVIEALINVTSAHARQWTDIMKIAQSRRAQLIPNVLAEHRHQTPERPATPPDTTQADEPE